MAIVVQVLGQVGIRDRFHEKPIDLRQMKVSL